MVLSLPERAGQDLAFIRTAIARVEGASAVSGVGGMLMGACGVAIALWAQGQTDLLVQLRAWLLGGWVAVPVGFAAVLLKARRSQLQWDPVRRFVLCLVPCLIVGGVLSWHLRVGGDIALIPAVWLMLYGCGVLAAGAYAVMPVRWMGVCFVVTGILATWAPSVALNALLGVAFGGYHIVFGWWVYRHHGG